MEAPSPHDFPASPLPYYGLAGQGDLRVESADTTGGTQGGPLAYVTIGSSVLAGAHPVFLVTTLLAAPRQDGAIGIPDLLEQACLGLDKEHVSAQFGEGDPGRGVDHLVRLGVGLSSPWRPASVLVAGIPHDFAEYSGGGRSVLASRRVALPVVIQHWLDDPGQLELIDARPTV